MEPEFISRKLEELSTNLQNTHFDAIGGMLKIKFKEYDKEKEQYFFEVKTEEWMRNIYQTVHGGISATIADQVMGLTARAFVDDQYPAPTTHLNITYVRPLRVEKDIIVGVHVTEYTPHFILMQADLYKSGNLNDKCVHANGTYKILTNATTMTF